MSDSYVAIEVVIDTNKTVTEAHLGLLDFGFLTVTNTATQQEFKLDSRAYTIEDDCVLVDFDTQLWDENDKPLNYSKLPSWAEIKAAGSLYVVELYTGFADDLDLGLELIEYSNARLDFGVTPNNDKTILPITLDY